MLNNRHETPTNKINAPENPLCGPQKHHHPRTPSSRLETSLLEFPLARIAAQVSRMIFPPSNAKASCICLKSACCRCQRSAACCLPEERVAEECPLS